MNPSEGVWQSLCKCMDLKSVQPEPCTRVGLLPGNIRHRSGLTCWADLKSTPPDHSS